MKITARLDARSQGRAVIEAPCPENEELNAKTRRRQDAIGGLLSCSKPSTGNETQTLVSRKSILRDALLLGASAFAIAHNHPTGVLEPSSEDRALTRALDEAAKIVGLNFVDHIIIADPPNGSGYYSFADNGLMKAA